eukprot:1393216-Amphidinium_carterae.1
MQANCARESQTMIQTQGLHNEHQQVLRHLLALPTHLVNISGPKNANLMDFELAHRYNTHTKEWNRACTLNGALVIIQTGMSTHAHCESPHDCSKTRAH